MRGTVRHVEWVGDDDPERLEAVTLTLGADRLDALGTSRTTDYVTSWSLETGPGWVTSRLTVAVLGRGFARRLVLTRDGRGHWSSEATQQGERRYQGAEMAEPGISDADRRAGTLSTARDCDLALCPVTNTMPVLRLGAHRGEVAETALAMAWVDLPSLAVVRSDQLYRSGPIDPGAGHATVHYANADGDFESDLTVDHDGVVIDYPQIARRVRTSA